MKVKAKCVNPMCRANGVVRFVRDERVECPEPGCGRFLWPIRTINGSGKHHNKAIGNGLRRKNDVATVKRHKPKRVSKRTSGKRIAR